MSFIIDRRLNAKQKSAVNRQRFLRRYRNRIKEAINDAVSNRSITDIDQGERIIIPRKDVGEPVFNHGAGGKRSIILPGNKDFIAGDRISRPRGAAGGAGGSASDKGEGMDDFAFQITQEEFLDFMFDDLALPNLVKHQLAGSESFKYTHGGIVNEGNPNQINIIRSLKSANARRIALTSSCRRELRWLEEELQKVKDQPGKDRDWEKIRRLLDEIELLKSRIGKVPFLDTFDLKYNLRIKKPLPSAKAIMFCIMDVSGSMNQTTKEMAKRFFILLYLFLQRNYDHTDVVFIRHHTSAREVDEEEFFYSRETGGTIVSSALRLMKSIIDERYPVSEWNIYSAQASDGDNWNDDSSTCYDLLVNQIMPLMQHYSYVEITPREHQSLWYQYELVKAQYSDTFALQQIIDTRDIYPVFRELFQRKMA